MLGKRFIIVGDGAAGITVAQRLRASAPTAHISIISDDPNPAYYRAALTNYLLGELREDQIWAVTPTFFHLHRIERIYGRVHAVDAKRSMLWSTHQTEPISYDGLMIASGARSRPPPFPGGDMPGVFVLRTLQDARATMDRVHLHRIKSAVIVGGGVLALEWAVALREHKVDVSLFVRERKLMGTILDDVASDLIAARLRRIGVNICFEEEIHAVLPAKDGWCGSVNTSRNRNLPCGMVGVAIGVIGSTDYLANTGITKGRGESVVVNAAMQTSIPNLYAAGDCAEFEGQLTQLWEPAQRQAMVAADTMAGKPAAYAPGHLYNATRLADLDFAGVGALSGDSFVVVQSRETGRISYKKLFFRGPHLVGGLMVGERQERVRLRGRHYKRLIDAKLDVTAIRNHLLDANFDLGAWLKKHTLVHKPVVHVAAPRAAVAPAKMKGTQALGMAKLTGLAGFGGAKPAGAAAAGAAVEPNAAAAGAAAEPNAAPKKAKMLSIGLQMAARSPAIAGPSAEDPWLVAGATKYPMRAPLCSIGSDPANQIVIVDDTISHVHAQALQYRGEWYLRDLGSATGTWINGKQVTIAQPLKPGDRIRMGKTELFYQTPSDPGVPISTAAPVAPPTGQPRLVVAATAQAPAAVWPLSGTTVTLGRDPMNVLQINDLSISRRHALLTHHQGQWFMSDLHSSQGTFQNGTRVPPGHDVPLNEGDRLRLGTLEMVFLSGAGA